ncbi:MAG: hypothetical protein Q9166_000133 [cf. Caloplaca sp. 2 TL-2023]
MSRLDQAVPYPLALTAHATVVEVGYRLSPSQPYPKPIHEVLAAYDWIRKQLLSSTPTKFNNGSQTNSPQKKLGVCGELAGGSLAAMLALTECHYSSMEPGSITTAALGNPIVDWTLPLSESNAIPDSDGLTRDLKPLYTTSFARPEHRYDPFASPLLFFRTPAYDLPTPSLYGMPLSPEPAGQGHSQVPDTHATSQLIPKRRSHRKYPPSGSELRLPVTRIHVGDKFMMKGQAVEFAELMRRSVNLYEEQSERANERVQIVEREGEGMWGEKEIAEIGSWMGEVLSER